MKAFDSLPFLSFLLLICCAATIAIVIPMYNMLINIAMDLLACYLIAKTESAFETLGL